MSVWLWLLCAVTEGLDSIRFWATKRDWQHQKGDVDGTFTMGKVGRGCILVFQFPTHLGIPPSPSATEPAMAFSPQLAGMRATGDADLSTAPLGSSGQDQKSLPQCMPRHLRYFVTEELATVPPLSSSQAVAESGM